MNFSQIKVLVRDNPRTAPYYQAFRSVTALPFYRTRDKILSLFTEIQDQISSLRTKRSIERYLRSIPADEILSMLIKPWNEIATNVRDERHYLRRYHPLFQRSAKILGKYKGKYSGKRCFIIGNGPSLKATDLDKLKGEFTFASNLIHFIYERTDWRPTFYTTQHPEVMKRFGSELSDLTSELKIVGVDPDREIFSIPGSVAIRVLFGFDFSDDITKYVWNGGTITHTNIQIATYFGFSDIILLGIDHRYAREIDANGVIHINEGVKSYFDPRIDPNNTSYYGSKMNEQAYEADRLYAEQHGIRIRNATRGGAGSI